MTSEPNGAAARRSTIAAAGQEEILRVEDLKVHFPAHQGDRHPAPGRRP